MSGVGCTLLVTIVVGLNGAPEDVLMMDGVMFISTDEFGTRQEFLLLTCDRLLILRSHVVVVTPME